ncbi:MAG: TMEM175 family protein [Bryobacteraceae bacterium]
MVTLSKSRIEALSDGVVAIAITLLVLELKVPEVMSHHSDKEMLEALLELKGEFATYIVTFLIAGAFWYLHHLTFHFIKHVDGFLVWVNLIFLMFVSLLPFSSGLMSHLFIHPVSQFFYFGNMLAIALLLNVHWQYARRKHLIVDTEQSEADRLSFRVALTAAAFAASFITAIFFPTYSWAPLPAFLLVGWILEKTRR